jgi:hypothetical protein
VAFGESGDERSVRLNSMNNNGNDDDNISKLAGSKNRRHADNRRINPVVSCET